MTRETEGTRYQRRNPMANDLRRPVPEPFPPSHTVPPEVEELLWDYALGLLEPGEEREVIRRLASNPEAEDTLVRLRQAMSEAGVPNPIELEGADELGEPAARIDAEAAEILRRAGERFASLLGRLSDELAAAAAVIVSRGDGLIGSAGAAKPLQLGFAAGLTLDASPPGPVTTMPARGFSRIDIPPLEGLGATVILISADRIDILVTASAPPVEGRVRLVRLVESAGGLVEEETGIEAYLRGSEPARLEECPSGMLRIISPDGRELVVCLGEPA